MAKTENDQIPEELEKILDEIDVTISTSVRQTIQNTLDEYTDSPIELDLVVNQILIRLSQVSGALLSELPQYQKHFVFGEIVKMISLEAFSQNSSETEDAAEQTDDFDLSTTKPLGNC